MQHIKNSLSVSEFLEICKIEYLSSFGYIDITNYLEPNSKINLQEFETYITIDLVFTRCKEFSTLIKTRNQCYKISYYESSYDCKNFEAFFGDSILMTLKILK
jgi:hypothetical protein